MSIRWNAAAALAVVSLVAAGCGGADAAEREQGSGTDVAPVQTMEGQGHGHGHAAREIDAGEPADMSLFHVTSEWTDQSGATLGLVRPETEPGRFPAARREEAAAIVARALGRGEEWLGAADVWALLDCYDLPTVPQRICGTPEDAARAAHELGGNVAIKGIAAGLVHKTDVGAVEIGIGADRVEGVARAIAQRLRQAGRDPAGFILQAMAGDGVEMIVGAVHDPQFGPVLAVGAGGALVELLKDVSVRIAPLAAEEARAMLEELKTYPALTGYRGSSPLDVDALVDIVLRVGAMVDELPQIQELDLNPVLVHARGGSIVDARVRLATV